jgi:hypothetical protein
MHAGYLWESEKKRRGGGWTILKWVLDRVEWYGLYWPGSGFGLVEGSCEHGNRPLGSIKFWEILE